MKSSSHQIGATPLETRQEESLGAFGAPNAPMAARRSAAFARFRWLSALNAKDQRDVLALILSLVILALYSPVIRFDFVDYDDPSYVVANAHVNSGLSWKGLWWSLSTLHGDVAYWHPLTWISHQLDFELFGANAGAHHMTSVLLHAANTVWVFLIAFRLLQKSSAAFLVALFFGIHPLRVESVAWISERKDVLCAFFYFAAIHGYLRYAEKPNWKRYLIVFGWAGCALMSKPMAVTLPVALLLLDFWPLRRLPGAWTFRDKPLPKPLVEKIPLFAAAALVAFLTLIGQRELKAIMPAEALPLHDRLANAAVSYAAYVHKTLVPVRLSVHYNHPFVQPLWLVMISAAAVACISGLAVRFRRRHPEALFGWLWFLATLVPAIGIVQAGSQSMADRYTYIPSLGLLLMLIPAIQLQNGANWSRPASRIATGLIAAMALTAATFNQLGHWRNSRALYEQALRVDPVDYLVHTNFGNVCAKEGQTAEAIAHFQAAIFANPASGYPKSNLGGLLTRHGHAMFALPFLFEALHSGDRIEALTHSRLGDAFSQLADFAKAAAHYQEAIRLKPALALAKIRLAEIFATCPDDRIRHGAEAIRLTLEARALIQHTHPEFESTLAAAYAETGDFKTARSIAEAAVKMARAQGKPKIERELLKRLDLFRKRQPIRNTAIARDLEHAHLRSHKP